MLLRVLLVSCVVLAAAVGLSAREQRKTTLQFEVTCGKDLLDKPQDGRVLVVLSKQPGDLVRLLGVAGNNNNPALGKDASGFMTGKKCILDETSAIFPVNHLRDIPKGEYNVQAVFDYNRDLRLAFAPENLTSTPSRAQIDPAAGGVVKIELTKKLPPDRTPADSKDIKYIRLKSEKLSKFHGRPIYLRAGVLLPPGHAESPKKRYPLRVHIGGFGQRYTSIAGMASPFSSFRALWNDKDTPQMILLHLDGAGPLGDPYQVDSANHGPYGAALTEELIPHVEKTYRGIGAGYARVLDGASTGGWVSFALQVFYPDFFNGCWSHCPDPVDFRSYELINLYNDDNAYTNRFGFERAAARTLDGDTLYTVRHEMKSEILLGRGDNWTLSGRDWASWNATFGPRGKDGLPIPVWDGKSGKIDRQVAEHYKKYDMHLHLEKNAATLVPKLKGKLRIYVGEADDYFLNNAVHRLDDALKSLKPSYDHRFTYGSRGGHSWQGITPKQMITEMAEAIERGRKAAAH